MARINIEDSIHKDIRFDELSQKLGGKQNALGAITWAWIVAQSYWTQNKNGIPKIIWKQQKIREEIIEVGLARENGDFIYICGSEEQFKWLDGAIASGKASAAKRLGKVPNADPTPTQARPTSSSSSSSSSSSNTNTNTKIAQRKRRASYDSGFEEVYDLYPRKEGKQAGFKIYCREIQSPEDKILLMQAVRNYANRKSGTEVGFLKHFGTFMAEWKDWLDPKTGTGTFLEKKFNPDDYKYLESL